MINLLKLAITLLVVTSCAQAQEITVSSMEPGELKVEDWNGIPVLIFKHSSSGVSKLESENIAFSEEKHLESLTRFARTYGNELASALMHGSKKLERLPHRSKRNDIIVLLGVSTFYGCAISLLPDKKRFVDPCSNTKYGLDGRIINPNQREYYHLLIPPHHYEGDILHLSDIDSEEIPSIDFSPDILSLHVSRDDKLIEAIQWRKAEVVHQILKKDINTNYELSSGATAMHVVAHKGSPSMIKGLYDSGFDLNRITREGVTPIQVAMLGQSNDNAKELLRLGAKTEEFCDGARCAKSLFDYLQSYYGDMTKDDYLSLINELSAKDTISRVNNDIQP